MGYRTELRAYERAVTAKLTVKHDDSCSRLKTGEKLRSESEVKKKSVYTFDLTFYLLLLSAMKKKRYNFNGMLQSQTIFYYSTAACCVHSHF